MHVSQKLKEFARFVREHELEGMTKTYLELVYAYDIPLLKYYTHLSEAEMWEQTADGVVKFLKGFEDDNALENVKESIMLWEAEQLPGISKLSITQLDIFLIGKAQKIAFLKLLPKYTANAETPTEILVELEEYYKETQWLSLIALQAIQQEQRQQLEDSEARYCEMGAKTTLNEYIKRLEDSEENMRQLLEGAPDGIVVVDRSMKIISWNPMAEKIFGWTSKEVIGKAYDELLIPKRHLPQYGDAGKKFRETGEWNLMGSTLQMVMQDKNRREFYVSLNASAYQQQGNPICISFLRDIDQMKKVELELDIHRSYLEEANKELEQYAWLASHDLKEPLRKILTFSDMLINRYSEGMDERVTAGLKKINGSAYRMHDMIEAVLSYSSLANTMDDLRMVDLNQVLADVLADLEMQVEEGNAQINITGLEQIEGNPIQLRQLFQNLVSNALKYTKPGVHAVVNIVGESKNGKHHITVADNGIGFDEQYSDKMFQIFKRLVTKDDYKGTGIGLALCRKIVENHCGTIIATSTEGQGAIFAVTLPLYQRE